MSLDFSNQNLRGRSFKGQDLTGANFSGADLRGVNFEKATLVKADFRQARTGMTHLRIIVHNVIVFLVASFFSFVAFLTEMMFILYLPTGCNMEKSLLELLNFSDLQQIGIATSRLVIFFGISYLTLMRGISSGLILVIGVVAVIVAGTEAVILAEAVTVAMVVTVATGAMVMAAVVTRLGIVAIAMTVVVAVAVATGAVIGTVVGAGVPIIIFAVLLVADERHIDFLDIVLLSKMVISYLCYVCYMGYLTWRIRLEDDRVTTIRQLGIALNAYGSTNFRQADLTEANFSEATLKSARFLNAITLRTCWQHAKRLETANLKGTILEKRPIRQLLVTGDGNNQSFAGLNLMGAFLVNANLQNVDFTETDFAGADLRGANLTGACLENWVIDSTTLLDNTHADYVYLLRNQQERRPARCRQ